MHRAGRDSPPAQPRMLALTYFVILPWEVAAYSASGEFVDTAVGTECLLETPGGKQHPGESLGSPVQKSPTAEPSVPPPSSRCCELGGWTHPLPSSIATLEGGRWGEAYACPAQLGASRGWGAGRPTACRNRLLPPPHRLGPSGEGFMGPEQTPDTVHIPNSPGSRTTVL